MLLADDLLAGMTHVTSFYVITAVLDWVVTTHQVDPAPSHGFKVTYILYSYYVELYKLI